MKSTLTLLLLAVSFSVNAQTSRPPGTVTRTIDSVSWNGTMQYRGSTFKLLSGGTVKVERVEERLVGQDTAIYAVSQSGRYYAMNPAAERHSGGNYAYANLSLARPGDELGAHLYDAGRSLRGYQGMKLASFGTGLASALTLAFVAQANSGPQTGRSNTGVYVVSGTLAAASLVFSLLADGQVYRAGRFLQLASGKINLGRSR